MSSTKQFKYFLIDCNQFYVSCEQVFNPKLKKKPVVVLSNNDGCVIARSKEAKTLNIPMGAPVYQFKEFFKTHQVHVFSSNFTLYGDMSQRVMQVLSQFSPEMQEYSIDEAFLRLEIEDPLPLAKEIKRRVLQWTGIPVCIGIGSTKTLAKVASDIAKGTEEGVFGFSDQKQIDTVLSNLDVKEIWGIGSNLSQSLKNSGITNALSFKECSDTWIQKRFSVVLLRTAYELRGTCCLEWNELPLPRKSIICSRSFGNKVTELIDLEEALSSYTAIAAAKLRNEKLLPSFITVFLMTSQFGTNVYSNSSTLTLKEPTAFTPELIKIAKEALHPLFRPGLNYKKVGVTMGGFFPEGNFQPNLFRGNEKEKGKEKRAILTMDKLKGRFGNTSIQFASEGLAKNWKMQRGNVSPRYTTSWDELLKI